MKVSKLDAAVAGLQHAAERLSTFVVLLCMDAFGNLECRSINSRDMCDLHRFNLRDIVEAINETRGWLATSPPEPRLSGFWFFRDVLAKKDAIRQLIGGD